MRFITTFFGSVFLLSCASNSIGNGKSRQELAGFIVRQGAAMYLIVGSSLDGGKCVTVGQSSVYVLESVTGEISIPSALPKLSIYDELRGVHAIVRGQVRTYDEPPFDIVGWEIQPMARRAIVVDTIKLNSAVQCFGFKRRSESK